MRNLWIFVLATWASMKDNAIQGMSKGILQHQGEYPEECWNQDAALFLTAHNVKSYWSKVVELDSPFHITVKGFGLSGGGGGSWFFAAVWRAHPCWPGQKLLSIFIPELTHGEHRVDSGPLSMKATLRFRSCSASFCNLVRRTLAMNLQTMLRREIPRSYTVWWCLHHLRHTALLPTSGDHVVQWGSKSQKIVLQQIGGMPSFPGALPGFNCLTVCTSWSIVGSASSKAHPVEEGYTGI